MIIKKLRCEYCQKIFETERTKRFCSAGCRNEAGKKRLTNTEKNIASTCICREGSCNGCIYEGNMCEKLKEKMKMKPCYIDEELVFY